MSWRLRRLVLVFWDCCAWLAALFIATFQRADLDIAEIDVPGLALIVSVAIVVQVLIGVALQLYQGRYWIGSVDDAVNVAGATALVGAVILVVDLFGSPPFVPRSVPMTAALVALVLSAGLRLAVRRYRERSSRPDREFAQRVIIYGAGSDGQQLVQSMLSNPSSEYVPVALLDDDPDKQRRRVSGLSVRGTREEIASVANQTRARLLIIAKRGADGELIQEVARAATDAGLRVKVLPPLSEFLRPWVGVSDLRDLDIADLLGRRPVDIDVSAIASYLTNKRVLVTGAGGSIGSELCRQIIGFGPAELLMLDRDESALHATQLSIYGRALLDSPDVLLADIRDLDALSKIFADRKPHVVFHAAALKHLPMLEQYPSEGWKTNVLGTQNVVWAAQRVGVERFVNISTDKAANPISALGRSKRIGEQLVAQAAIDRANAFLSVRFGNVLGSRGSVVTTFAEQISAGFPITITHPDVTRFFMTIPEAVQLVIYAAAIGRPGEALVLDMGAPVKIADVARQLMDIAGRAAEIVYTGLRPGEKLHEELFGHGEIDSRPIHPAISHVAVPGVTPGTVIELAETVGPSEAMRLLTGGGTDGADARPQLPTRQEMQWQPI